MKLSPFLPYQKHSLTMDTDVHANLHPLCSLLANGGASNSQLLVETLARAGFPDNIYAYHEHDYL